MSENRGMAGSRSNANLPSTQGAKSPDGINKPDKSSFNRIDTKTIKDMMMINKKFSDEVMRMFGTLNGFKESIEKATDENMKVIKSQKDKTEKMNDELNALIEEFGENNIVVKKYRESMTEEITKMKNETMEIYDKSVKDFMKQSFKNESESKQISYLDNKFAKNNNLAKVSNDYYSDLEKLKSQGLETYGEGFENNKEYKKALMNMNENYNKQMKDAWKEDFKENHKVLSGIAGGIKDTFEKNKESLAGLLGPFNLILSPLKDFFGGFGMVFKFLGGGIKKLFGAFVKKNPTASDVMKSGMFGVGSLYIANVLEKLLGKKKGEEKSLFELLKDKLGGLKDKLKGVGTFAKGVGAKALGGASKFLTMGHGALAGGLGIAAGGALIAKDAFKGSKMAGQEGWSESKVSSALGGALGGFDSGFKGAFKNMGKWALMGFGIGNVICPIVGGIIGGLIGAAVGGILGWIGGAKISKAMDSVGAWFKNVFTKGMATIKKGWEKTKAFASLAKDKTITKSKEIKKAITGFISSSMNAFSERFNKVKDFAGNVWGNLKAIGKDAMEHFGNGTFFTDFIPELLNKIKDKLFEGFNMLKESPLGKFVQKLFENITNGMNKFFKENPVGQWMDSYIIGPIKNAFGQMGAWFSYIGEAFESGGIMGALSAMTKGTLIKDKETGLTDFEAYKQKLLNPTESVDDAIIRADGSIIKTNPRDTLVALKNIPLSMDKVRSDANKSLNDSLSSETSGNSLEEKLSAIIDVLSKILDKDIQINLPPQTRYDLDAVMCGGTV